MSVCFLSCVSFLLTSLYSRLSIPTPFLFYCRPTVDAIFKVLYETDEDFVAVEEGGEEAGVAAGGGGGGHAVEVGAGDA